MTAAKAICAILATCIVAAGAASARADVVFDGRWQKPGVDRWDAVVSLKHGNRNKLRFVETPRRRRSGYSADLRVGGNRRSERINFVKVPLFADAEGRDTWIAWSTYVPRNANLPARESQVNIVSFFSKFNAAYCDIARGGAAGTVYLYSRDPGRRANRWAMKLTGGIESCSIRAHTFPGLGVSRRRWIDFLCHFRWAAVAGRALSQCRWRVQPTRRWSAGFVDTGPNIVRSKQFPGSLSIHYGLYKGERRPYVHLIQGGLVVATTRAEAERAAFGPSRPPPARLHGVSEHGLTPGFFVAAGIAAAALLLLTGTIRAQARRTA